MECRVNYDTNQFELEQERLLEIADENDARIQTLADEMMAPGNTCDPFGDDNITDYLKENSLDTVLELLRKRQFVDAAELLHSKLIEHAESESRRIAEEQFE